MPLAFTKWEGLGNDFVVVEGPPPSDAAELARQICDRHRGVGADGLVYLTAAPGMEIFNHDGSYARMCGNALRCLAALAVRRGFLTPGVEREFATASGLRRVKVISGPPWWVEVDMGPARIDPTFHDFEGLRFQRVSTGNPHAVCLDPHQPRERWEEIGRLAQRAPFAEHDGVNVEFVERDAAGELHVWVYERGVGPTLACGTGACASFALARATKLCDNQAIVHLPGGPLELEWSDGTIKMRGRAREVFYGTWRDD